MRISELEVLKGRQYTVTKLWRIPLNTNIANPNSGTLILNSKEGKQSINSLYSVPTSKTAVHHVQTLMTKHIPESINNIYEIPSIERTIKYLHAEAGFSKNSTGHKAIQRGNYVT